ncbi:baeRF3 domain-containing protein [Dietzia maris]|uniref:baeRF3 domain-containing protein n=1 Tax=Dietzia maris TaxID=37915 RepID=UPI0030FC3A15
MADVTRTAEVDPIPLTDLAELGTASGRAVSIFLPTARAGAEVRENPIRAKSLIKDAETRLKAHGVAQEESDEILGPLVALLEDDAYWQRLSDGLALFASKGFWRAYRLSTDVAEAVHVSDRFAVRPIVPAAVGDGEFLVLAGSQNKVRLLEGTASTIRELDLGSIPSSIDDMAGDTQPPSHQQQRFSAGAGAGPGANRAGGGMVHSHGTGAEVGDVQREKFLRQIAKGLQEALRPNDRRPVVLAAVTEHLPQFRGYLNYEHLVDEVAAGNPDALSPAELHERAWAVVRPAMQRQSDAVAERFGDAIGAGRALAGGGSDILHAAREGRVETLLLTRRRCTAEHGPDDLDTAVGQVLATSGSVVVVDSLPKDVAEGAILRF